MVSPRFAMLPRLSRSQLVTIVSALALLALALAPRLSGITSIGISGSDTVYYLSLASLWAEGETAFKIDGGAYVFRPVLLGLYALAINLIGPYDFSVKLLNIAADGFTILILWWILSKHLSINSSAAAIFAGLYAFSPFAIMMARTELTTPISTLLVTSSFLVFLHFSRAPMANRAPFILSACGVLVGLATCVHEELGLLVAGYGATVVVLTWGSLSESGYASTQWLSLVVRLLALTTAFALLAAVPAILHLTHPDAQIAAAMTRSTELEFVEWLTRPFRYAWNGLAGTLSSWAAIALVAAATGLALARSVRLVSGRDVSSLTWVPLLLIGSFLVIYSAFFPVIYVRNSLPLVPLAIVALAAITKELLSAAAPLHYRQFRDAALACTALVLLVSGLANFANQQQLLKRDFSNDWHIDLETGPSKISAALSNLAKRAYSRSSTRKVFDAMQGIYQSGEPVLFASSLSNPYPGRRGFDLPFYFGEDAIFIIDESQPLDQMIRQRKIRYIHHSGQGIRSEILRPETASRCKPGCVWRQQVRPRLGVPVGLEKREFSYQEEYASLLKVLSVFETEIVATSGSYSVDATKAGPVGGDDYVIFRIAHTDERQ